MGVIYLICVGRLKDKFGEQVFRFSRIYNTKIIDSLELNMDRSIKTVLRDNIGIYKFGKTKDVSKRFTEHCADYGSQCRLVCSKTVLNENLTKEEARVKGYFLDKNHYFVEASFDGKRQYKELVLIRDEDINQVIIELISGGG
jgi:hypothetical protein